MAQLRRPNRVVAIVSAVLALLALLLLGGYGLGWRWTGMSSRVTLWDWLEALALPVAVASVPILLRHRRRLTRRHHSMLALVLALFGALVTVGYLVPLGWTGFSGNTLWNWLELLVLPVAVATATLWPDPRSWDARPRLMAAGGVGVFLVLVTCGYLVPWRWTGFSGNTMWDWTKLLLVPLLIPTVLVPTVIGRLDERLARSTAPDRESL